MNRINDLRKLAEQNNYDNIPVEKILELCDQWEQEDALGVEACQRNQERLAEVARIQEEKRREEEDLKFHKELMSFAQKNRKVQ